MPSTLGDKDTEMMDALAPTLQVALDYATKNVAVAVRVISPGDPRASEAIFEPVFMNGKNFTPQIVGILKDDKGNRKYYWGTECEIALQQGELEVEDTIEMWKLALYKDHRNSATVKNILQQMKKHDVSLDELISRHIGWVLQETRVELGRSLMGMRYDIRAMEVELLLSVPQMWEPPACQTMLAAARMVAEGAGIRRTMLVPEPECAAAHHFNSFKNTLSLGAKLGEEFIIVDIGGGTGDFLRVKYVTDPSDGAQVVLMNTGKASGCLCGSQFVNEEFLEWLRKKAVTDTGKSFDTICGGLGITVMDGLKQASDQFEKFKLEFILVNSFVLTINIRGHNGDPDNRWEVNFTNNNMPTFFEGPLFDITTCIEEQLRSNTKAVLITGGLGRSRHVLDHITAYLKKHQVDVRTAYTGDKDGRAVSNGALARWPELETHHFDTTSSFGLATEEVYDPTRHPDAVANPKLVAKSPHSDLNIVYERWSPLLTQNTARGDDESFRTEIWQESILPADSRTLNIQVYWTKSAIAQSDPMRTGSTARSALREHIEPWGPPLEIELPDLEALGFETALNQQGDGVYEFHWRVTMVGDGPNVSFIWEMAKAGEQPFDAEGRPVQRDTKTTGEVVHSLCDGDFNPFPRSKG